MVQVAYILCSIREKAYNNSKCENCFSRLTTECRNREGKRMNTNY